MKRNPLRHWLPAVCLSLAASLIAAWPQRARAADIWWDNTGGTANDWGSMPNWSTVVGGGTNPAALPGTSDTAIFNATPLTAAQTISLGGADRVVGGLSMISGGAVTIQGTGSANRNLEIGASGILKTGAGAFTIGNTATNTNANIRLSADQSWINNNNTGAITIVNGVTVSTAVNRALTLGGTSTAANTISGVMSNNGTGVLSVVKTGASTWVLGGANTYTGGTTISGGVLRIGANAGAGTAGITINTGGRLQINNGVTMANNITIASGVTGVASTGLIQHNVAANGQSRINGTITLNGVPGSGGTFMGSTTVGNEMILAGAISGSVGASQRDGRVIYMGGGTATGNFVSTGTVIAGANNGIPTGWVQQLGGSGNSTLELNGYDQQVAGIQLGNATNTFVSTVNIGAKTLTLAGNITNVTGATQAVTHFFNATTGGIDTGSSNRTLDVVNAPNIEDVVLNVAAITGSGGLTKTGTGTLSLGSTLGTTTVSGPLTISAGALTVGRDNTASTLNVASIDFASGTTLNMNVGTGGDLITATTATAIAAGTTLNLSQYGGALAVGTYPILTYSGVTPGVGSFTTTMPGHVTGSLIDTGSAIALSVTGNDKVVWDGTTTTAWSTGTTGNWKLLSTSAATDYIHSDDVIFQDAPTNSTVDVATGVQPSSIALTNTTATTYTFTGTGGISGTTGITKTGNGTAAFRTPTTYAGATTISEGKLEFDYDAGNSTTLSGTSGISIASGATLALTRDGTATANNVTLAAPITGSGNIDVNLRTGAVGTAADSLTLSGNNLGFSGKINLQAPASGTYRLAASNTAVGGATINVASGAQLMTTGGQTYNNAITIAGKGYQDSGGYIGALRLENGTNWAGNIVVDAAGARIGSHNATGTVSGSISGGDLNVNGSDGNFANNYTVIFTGTNSYGKTTIGGGSTASSVLTRRLNIGNGGTTGTLGSGAVVITGDAQNGALGFDRSDGYTLATGQSITVEGATLNRTFVDIETLGAGFSDNGNIIHLGGNTAATGGSFRVGQARAGAIANLSGTLTAGNFLVGAGQGNATASLNSGAAVNVGSLRVGAAGTNLTSTLNVNTGSTLTAGSLGLGEAGNSAGVLNQAAGSTVNVDTQLRVGHWATNTSTYNMNGGTLTLTGASSNLTPSTAGGGGNGTAGDNNIDGLATATLNGGGIYLGIDGTGIFNHNAGTVTTNWIVLDNRTATGAGTNMPDGIDAYNLSGSGSVLNLRSTWGIIGRNEGSYALNLGGGTVKIDNTGTGGLAGNTGANLNVPLDATIDTVASTTTNLDTNGAGNAFTLTKDVRGTGKLNLTGGGNINVSTTGVQTLSSDLSGTASLTKIGTGTTTLAGNASTFTGNVFVNAGRLNVPNSLGAGDITVADGAALSGEPVLVNTLTLGSTTGATLFFDPSTPGTLTTSNLVVNGTTTLDITNLPTGPAPYTVIDYTSKSGTGTFAIANPANYRTTPTVTDTTSTIEVTLAAGMDLTWTGTTSSAWNINSTSNWVNPISAPDVFYTADNVTFPEGGLNPAVALNGLLAPASIKVNSATTNYSFLATAGNQIAGATGIEKTGTSTLTLGGVHSYSGITKVGGGIVSIDNTNAIGSGGVGNSIELSGGGKLVHTGGTALNLGVNRHIAVGTGGGGLVHNNAAAATLTVAGNLSGTGDLNLASQAGGGGNFVLTGANSAYTGAITVDSLSTGISTLTISAPDSVPNASAIKLNYPALGANGNATTLSLTNASLPAATTLQLTSLLSGTNSLRTQVATNGTAAINGPVKLSGTSIVQLSPNAGTLTVNGDTTEDTAGFNAATSIYFLRGNANGVMNGKITLPSATVTKTDPGTWTLNSTGNSWANSSISVGTLNLGAANALPAAVNLTMGQNDTNAATLNLNGFNQTIGSLTSSPTTAGTNTTGKVITSATAATLTINQSISTTYASLLNGALSIVKSGTGNLTLNATTSNFTGNVSVDNGTLTAAAAGSNAAGALGANNIAGKTVTVGATGILAMTSNNIFGNGVGNTALPKVIVNGGSVTATRYNVIGDVELNGGTLTQASTDAGSYQGFQHRGNITVGGSAPSSITTTNGKGNHLGTNTVFTVGDVTGDAAPDLTVSVPLLNLSADFASAAGGFTKEGAGTMTLTSGMVSTYTGSTVVNAGTLNVNGNIASSSGVTVNAGGTLSGSGIIPSVTFADGATLSPGNSPGTLVTTGSATFSATSLLTYDLNGMDLTVGGGVNDLLQGVVNLTLDGALNVLETSPGSFLAASIGDKWTLITYSGTLTNNTLDLGSMPALSAGNTFEIDTTEIGKVNLVVVPETSSAILLGLGGLIAFRRRRPRAA